MSGETLLILSGAALLYYHLEGKRNPLPPPAAPGTTPPQSKGTSPAGAAMPGSCPPNLTNTQCAEFLNKRMALEETKAWAGVASDGIKTGGGLLGQWFK